ncbi:DUF5320 domain-containing protein [Proteinivorax tanatarense]|uniref:DUF5320 domain-containing protein n=1 Tax=Proteinivorax tanatarense TaxID=1260629 RepID=A0AAU7VNA4_9FIRM
MPNLDGTGPISNVSTTRKGFGICNNDIFGRRYQRAGFGRRRRAKRDFGNSFGFGKKKETNLKRQKELLEAKLESIDKQLESL